MLAGIKKKNEWLTILRYQVGYINMNTRKSDSYIGTMENNEHNWERVKALRRFYHIFDKQIKVYGRGPRKAVYKKLARNKKNWESKFKWGFYSNRFYRPKLAYCQRFDMYLVDKSR
jgi:hypothetical protein